ncbi:MAG: hypothetical protein AUJ72_03310 [Candidatus Omnitrophica bacterium CG1_02_46_14]|nr:MAG: hypothetical protein AUJ72_03310 [Candidatus Omnitrophica bacterium CG1_02_46_14]
MIAYKKKTVLLMMGVLAVFLCTQSTLAAERVELKDEDGDGRKETEITTSGDKMIKAVVDKNGDKKPDQWIYFKNGVRSKAQIDSDYDGKLDEWVIYDAEGRVKARVKDTNHDGKPDYFQTFIQGRGVVLREYDRNFDGRIDRRMLMQWDGNKKITTFLNGRLGSIPNPGYVYIWKEEDNDYDGKIDVYQERGNKKPSTEKIGKEMDPLPTKSSEDRSASDKKKAQPQNGPSESIADKMNKKYGL